MIMFDYLTTKGVKHPKKWLYNMEAAPYNWKNFILCRLQLPCEEEQQGDQHQWRGLLQLQHERRGHVHQQDEVPGHLQDEVKLQEDEVLLLQPRPAQQGQEEVQEGRQTHGRQESVSRHCTKYILFHLVTL